LRGTCDQNVIGSGTLFLLKRFPIQVLKRRTIMKKIALGLVAAAALFTAAPAMAQIGFYAGPGGVGVGVGAPGPYYRCGYDYPCDRNYYDYYNGPEVTFGVGPGWHEGWHGRNWHR
jgi:hypothetical protein